MCVYKCVDMHMDTCICVFINGVVPEVILLKELTFENGLPIGEHV
jgi:hypothetical protein